MKVKVSEIRPAYQKAKAEFSSVWVRNNPAAFGFNESFWKDFGDANNMKVSVDCIQFGFPKITVLEFNSEKDYVWFMLRWS